MTILGRLTWFKLFVYMFAQYLGAFVASACIYGVYYGRCAVNSLSNVSCISCTHWYLL